MSGKIIPTIWGEGWRFSGIGWPPTFWSLRVGLGTVMMPLNVSLACGCATLSRYWETSTHSSWLVCHPTGMGLGPIRTHWALISLCWILNFSKVVLCPPTSYFTSVWWGACSEPRGEWFGGFSWDLLIFNCPNYQKRDRGPCIIV